MSAGQVWIYLESTSNGGCVPVVDSVLIVYTTPPTVDAGTNFIACTNAADIILNGLVGGATTTGEWTGGVGSYSISNTDLTATYSPTAAEIASGTMFLTLTSTNNGGCLSVNDNVQINFVAPPIANFSAPDECLYNESTFSDFSNPGYGNINSWAWDFGDLGTSTDQNTTHNYATAGSYSVTLTIGSDAGCFHDTTFQVEAFEVPVAGFTYTSTCPNNQITVQFTDASSTVVDPISMYSYDFGGEGNSGDANPLFVFPSDDSYDIVHIVQTSNGCVDTITQTLTVPALPDAGFSYNTSNGLNIGAVFNFINTSTNANSYFWDLGNGNTSTQTDTTNVYFANQNYVVTLYAYGELGCQDSISQTITINTVTTEINTLIPNAISPNGDFKNDVWKLEFLDLLFPDARVEIYNDWGQLLFESDGYDEPWDGTYNQELVPDGTYYYVIDLNDLNAPDDGIFKGTILVLKSKN